MRIRVVQRPTLASVDGIRLDHFEPGSEHELGSSLGALFLAEGWGVPVVDDVARRHDATLATAIDTDADPPNLQRDTYPPIAERLGPDIAAEFERYRLNRQGKPHG